MSGWIVSVVGDFGYPGIVFLMVLEAVFPPIPSELIIPFAGYAAATGALDPVLVVLSASLGSAIGAWFWYLIGRTFGLERAKRLADRNGRFLAISSRQIDIADAWFDRFGWLVVLFGRLLPILRTLISIPAGLTGMPFPVFAAASITGIALWNSILVGAGLVLHENYVLLKAWVDPLSYLVLGGIVAAYLWRVLTWRTPDGR